jgi:hypothetical protein
MDTIPADPNLTLTLLSWQPDASGLPQDLFQPSCVITVGQDGTETYLSWPYGGGGTCTLGPPPPGKSWLKIPGQPPLSVGVTVALQGGKQPPMPITFVLLNYATGNSGQFTVMAA